MRCSTFDLLMFLVNNLNSNKMKYYMTSVFKECGSITVVKENIVKDC